jgi:DNA-binding transcriptional LysR family regulator
MESTTSTFTIDIRRLRVLRELRQRGTLGATAKALALTPSAISQQLSALGREIGVPLLAPQGRGVRLTPQAELLLEHASVIDAQLERARADLAALSEGVVGRVVLGAFGTAISGVVVPALARLRRERPRLRLGVREVGPECFPLLDRGELDLAISVDHRGGPTRGDPRYARWELLDDPLLLALPSGHRLAGAREVDLLALADEPWIMGGIGGPCREVAPNACATAGFTPAVAHEVDDWGAALRLVALGCGVGLVPELASRAPPPGVVLRRPAGPLRPRRHLFAAARAGADRSPHIAAVVAALVAAAGAGAASVAAGAAALSSRRSAPARGRPRPSRRARGARR